MGTFEAVQAQYEKNKNAGSGVKFQNQEERMKKYFTTILPKGTSSGEKRVRILPSADGGSPFVEIYFHEVQVDGKWLKLWDPKQEGKRSPLNEVKESLEATGREEDNVLARSYRARKFYIVKVIDRDNEADGPKFWRFKHNSKQEGILDKIFPIFRSKGDITDPETGRDVILTLTLAKSNNGKDYTSISSIIQEDPSVLHTDKEISKKWVEDELVWSDVYAKKTEDYLEMVANGETPKWDNDKKGWVSGTTSEETIGGNKTESTNQGTGSTATATKVEPTDSQANEDPEEVAWRISRTSPRPLDILRSLLEAVDFFDDPSRTNDISEHFKGWTKEKFIECASALKEMI